VLVPTAALACWYRVVAWRVLLMVVGENCNLVELARRPFEYAANGRKRPSLLATILEAMVYVWIKLEAGAELLLSKPPLLSTPHSTLGECGVGNLGPYRTRVKHTEANENTEIQS